MFLVQERGKSRIRRRKSAVRRCAGNPWNLCPASRSDPSTLARLHSGQTHDELSWSRLNVCAISVDRPAQFHQENSLVASAACFSLHPKDFVSCGMVGERRRPLVAIPSACVWICCARILPGHYERVWLAWLPVRSPRPHPRHSALPETSRIPLHRQGGSVLRP